MTGNELFVALNKAEGIADVERALSAFEELAGPIAWVPVGGRANNRGTIEVSGNTGRALVERITNGIDAVLEREHAAHAGRPECRSPREAATAWLNVPDDGLSKLSPRQRQQLAEAVVVTLYEGDGPNLRTVDVIDSGVGLAPEEMPGTILSLNESNKIQKHYLAGTYGQGGSATFAASRYTLIASRKGDADIVAYTVVKYLDLPPEQYKTGHYVYLTAGGQILQVRGHGALLGRGTRCRHFGYDLTKFAGSFGPGSVYGLLQQVLFDPVLPIWLDNRVHGWRRVIKGSRNALKGAVDEGDEARGPKLSHAVTTYFVDLREFGRIGIEYWVLADDKKRPSASFVDPRKPVILTLNGQNQAELTQTVIRDADLPYLAKRLIVHVDCNALTPAALRSLFVSNREGARAGVVKDLIEREVVQALRTDDDLVRLNKEARENTLRERDENAVQETRREVARILKVQGYDVDLGTGAVAGREGTETKPSVPVRRPRPKPPPIDLHEPPTFIRIVGAEDAAIRFWPEQRRYVRLETDALSYYHNAKDLSASKVNVVIEGRHLALIGTTPLEGGRMRVIIDCSADAQTGDTGTLRVELARTGLPTLSDQRSIEVVRQPEAREKAQKMPLPRFNMVPVEGPEDPNWGECDWPDNVNAVASSAIKNEGVLDIYYSTVYPKYVAQLRRLEAKDPALAKSFTKRYEIWLAVHSLILDDELNRKEEPKEGEAADAEAWEQRERCRVATISAMFAAKEALSTEAVITEADDSGPS